MTQDQLYRDLAKLRECGYQIEAVDNIARNAGSETLKHRVAKMSTAHVLWENGYHVASEVEINGKFADILGLGNPGRNPIVVELETDATESDREEYRELYGAPVVREVFTINVSELSCIPEYQVKRIQEELGL
jgi:hypothetical protein